jgi:hypothetical protein
MSMGRLLPGAGGTQRSLVAPQADWQKMWLATQTRPWHTLGLVPVDTEISPTFALEVAVHMARAGMAQLGAQVHVADATGLTLENSLEFKRQLRETQEDGRVIVAFAPPSANALTIQLAQTTDAVLLCVVLGHARSAEAKEIVNNIGARLFLGAVTFG